ncbi:MAG: hypothetical protein DI537_34085 [Stutzerimonas stutzeri]|nr:MAG: hypothetical protein DI537_34085 [Stutzerimonas stutzeri]
MTGARMWPARLPKQVRDNEQRSAEVRVYDALEAALGPEWTVFYSRPWLGLNAYGEERDGEADFVVVHPVRGYLAIEEKGGAISWNPETDVWISEDRNKIRHIIKNPVEQAKSSKHRLLDNVKEMMSWPGRFIRMRHGVIFPDTVSPPDSLGADKPRELFCCRPDMPRIGDWVRNRLSGEKAGELGPEGVRAFEELLARPINLRVPLAHHFDDDEEVIAALTPQQFFILSSFMHLPRVAAGGGAGTGKTIVAMEDAARLAEAGLRTALLCVGRNLAAHLRETLRRAPVHVYSLSELCMHLTEEAGLVVERCGAVPTDTAIESLALAVRRRPDLCFDAIVVDEAQDVRSHWWIVMEELLRDQKTSKLHAFYDTNQSVYGDVATQLASFSAVPMRLTRNLRNTRHIHSAASRFYEGFEIIADGPEGPVVEWNKCSEAGITASLMARLRSLTEEDGIHPEKIAILAVNYGLVTTLATRTSAFDGLTVEHVQDFKGLERQVVLLAATREIADFQELAYVALSRPRVLLSVFGEDAILSWLETI